VALQQEIQSLTNPVPPFGAAIVATVEDLQAQTQLKVLHARQAVDTTLDLLALDLIEASFWMDVRRLQTPGRDFGPGPTAVWTAFRKQSPLRGDPNAPVTPSTEAIASAFVHGTDPTALYPLQTPLVMDVAPGLPAEANPR
jgi:histidine ammonia-lyase